MDMATSLNCNPNFNEMEFFEFMSKYDILKKKLKNKKNGNTVDFLQNLKKFLGN